PHPALLSFPTRRSSDLNFVCCPVPVLGVIPARLGSSRLPRKLLLSLAGEPLILWTARRANEAGVCDRLVVATDAREIAAVAERADRKSTRLNSSHVKIS